MQINNQISLKCDLSKFNFDYKYPTHNVKIFEKTGHTNYWIICKLIAFILYLCSEYNLKSMHPRCDGDVSGEHRLKQRGHGVGSFLVFQISCVEQVLLILDK